MNMHLPEAQIPESRRDHWLKRMGVAGFAFFFIKGMLWLLIPWLAHSTLF